MKVKNILEATAKPSLAKGLVALGFKKIDNEARFGAVRTWFSWPRSGVDAAFKEKVKQLMLDCGLKKIGYDWGNDNWHASFDNGDGQFVIAKFTSVSARQARDEGRF